jgi:hypothetical protein
MDKISRQVGKGIVTNAQIQTLASALVSRMNLATSLGVQSYGGARDIYEALGYKTLLTYQDFVLRYDRQDIAKAVIDRPAIATWQGDLFITDSNKGEDTALEKKWKELDDKFSFKSIFLRADKCAGLGKYGVLLLGLDDTRTTEDFRNPARVGSKLLYLRPFGQGSAIVNDYVIETTDPRYGLPLNYGITVQQAEQGNSMSITVHYSRVVHIVDDIVESEIEGSPRLEAVFNRLMDLEKLVGGDAEMFWRGARPGYSGVAGKDYQVTDATMTDLKDQVDEFEHNLRRILISEGIDLKALAQQIADPATHVDVQIQMIAAATGIPKRVLVGTERGELSSAQDALEYKIYVKSRREDFAELRIVRPFVNSLIALKILPTPNGGKYTVKWSDLFAVSEADRVKIGLDRSSALKNYTSSPTAEAVMSPEDFLKYGLGLQPDDITSVKDGMNTGILEEARAQKAIQPFTQPAAQPKQPIVKPKQPITRAAK